MAGGIYRIACSANDMIYIGSAKNYSNRWRAHRKCLWANKHHCRHLQFAWNKYGELSFKFESVEHVSDAAELITREQYYIDVNAGRLFNSCLHAGNCLGTKASLETRLKQSSAGKGRVGYWKGIKKSDEVKAKVSAKLKGRIFSEELKKKIREGVAIARQGKPYHWLGRTHSPETIQKMSAARTQWYAEKAAAKASAC
jgi:group I intron endonuclease